MTKTETAVMNTSTAFTPFPTKEFNANLRRLDSKINGLDTLVHELLVTAIYHAQEHNNYDFVGRVLTSVKRARTIRFEGIRGWCQKHCNVRINDSGAEVRTDKDKKSEVETDWKKAYANPFWDDQQFAEPKFFGVEDAIKSYYAVVTKIRRAAEGKAKNVEIDEKQKGVLVMMADMINANGQAMEKAIQELTKGTITNEDEVESTTDLTETSMEPVAERTGTDD